MIITMLFDVIKSATLIEYNYSLVMMQEYVASIQKGDCKPILWLLEHEVVYSAGTSIQTEHIKNHAIKIVHTGRGGSVTVHSPGQRVIYLMFPIKKYGINIGDFIDLFERSIMQTIQECGGSNVHKSHGNRGVWINNKKIAFLGIHVSKGVTYHGAALNVFNDLSYYSCIDTCGLKDGITSLHDQGIRCNMHEVDKYLIDNIHNNLLLLI